MSKRSHVCSRAARAIANLAKDRDNFLMYLSLNTISSILSMLRQTTDTDPQQCGLRALHLFLSDASVHATFFERSGIQIVLSLLKSPNTTVVASALKVVEQLSWFDTFHQQLKEIDCGYDFLLNLTSHAKQKIQHSALHALLLCSKFSDCCSSIATADGIHLFLSHLQHIQDKDMRSFIAQILCYCCWNVVCRNRMIEYGGVAKMIEMLGDSDFDQIHEKVLSALMCYYYDEPGLKRMVRLGLVSVLIQRLHSLVEMLSDGVETPAEIKVDPVGKEAAVLQAGDDMQLETCSQTDKLPLAKDLQSPIRKNRWSDMLSPIVADQRLSQCRDSSPTVGLSPPSDFSSSFSPEALSPTTSEPTSPQWPVCSQLQDDMMDDSDTFTQHPMEQRILSLLSKVSLMKACIPAFLAQDVLKVLVGYIRFSHHPHPKAMRILRRLAENRGCLEHLIMQQAAPLIYHQFCAGDMWAKASTEHLVSGHRLLDILRQLAESDYGQGLIAHKLIRGSRKEVKCYALSLPYVSRSKLVCQKLFGRYKGLECLVDLLRKGLLSDQELEFAVCGLSLLAKNLTLFGGLDDDGDPPLAKQRKLAIDEGGSDEKERLEETKCLYDVATGGASGESKRLITLRLDSGKTVICCQDVLVNGSDYFRAMLSGSFRESDANCVDLPGVDYQALLAVGHSLHGCSWTCRTVMESRSSTESQMVGDDDPDGTDDVYNLGLHVIALSNQLLLTDLSEECQSLVSTYITDHNLVELFHFACMHSATLLSERCVQLWMQMTNLSLQTEIFKHIMESQDKETLLLRVTSLLSETLRLDSEKRIY